MFNRYKFSIKSKSASFMYLIFLVFQILLSFLLYYKNKSKNYFFRSKNKIMLFVQSIFYLWYLQTIIILSGDIETNPGSTNDNNQYLTICYRNINSITTDNFIKFLLLEAYISTHKFDIICLSETFLDSSLSDDDPRLSLKGYLFIDTFRPS